MTKYKITGTVAPDCTIDNIEEPSGEFNGQSYWTWTNDAGTWYLLYSTRSLWMITTGLFSSSSSPNWTNNSGNIIGEYIPGEPSIPGFPPPCAGIATISENIDEETPTEVTYSIQNISNISTNINNNSMIIRVGGDGAMSVSVVHSSENPSNLIIEEVQDKYDNRFNDRTYYWNKQTGV